MFDEKTELLINLKSNQAILGEVEVCPLEAARDQFEVMFWGPVHICKEVSGAAHFRKNTWLGTHMFLSQRLPQAVRIFREVNPPGEGGHIFNVSSAGGYFAQPSIPYYAASKFGKCFFRNLILYFQLLTSIFFHPLPRSVGRVYRIPQKGNDSKLEHSSYYNRTWRFQHRMGKYDNYTSSPSVWYRRFSNKETPYGAHWSWRSIHWKSDKSSQSVHFPRREEARFTLEGSVWERLVGYCET